MGIVEILVIMLVLLVGLALLILGLIVRSQERIIKTLTAQFGQLALFNQAAGASKEIHPMTGPAILQQMRGVVKPEQPKEEEKPKEHKTGVVMTQGGSI